MNRNVNRLSEIILMLDRDKKSVTDNIETTTNVQLASETWANTNNNNHLKRKKNNKKSIF